MSDTNGVMGQEAIAVLNHWQAKVERLRDKWRVADDLASERGQEIERLRGVLSHIQEMAAGDIKENYAIASTWQIEADAREALEGKGNVRDQRAEIELLQAERDEARYAARWLYQWIEGSEWTHFCKEDGDMLKQWTWLLEATKMSDIQAVVDRLSEAQMSFDFRQRQQALVDSQKALEAYQEKVEALEEEVDHLEGRISDLETEIEDRYGEDDGGYDKGDDYDEESWP